MESTINTVQEQINEVGRKWYWFLIVGIICLAGGLLAMYQPFIATLTVELFAAWIFIFAGILQIIQGIQTEAKGKVWIIVMGVLMAILGIALLRNPLAGIMSLTAVAATLLIISGIAKIIYSFEFRPINGWVWLLFSGIVSTILGIMIFANFQQLMGVALGIFLAVDLIISGTMLILTSFHIKKLATS